MQQPDHIDEVTLQPGEFHFGDRNTRIRTLLGSCVSMTMWHPGRLIGGMCHYMLPTRGGKRISQLDGRYGEESMLMFFREAVRHGTDPKDYVVKVFGGGNMFPEHNAQRLCRDRPCREVFADCRNVSCKNGVLGTSQPGSFGLNVASRDIGGTASRQVIFDIWSGHVWVRHNKHTALPTEKRVQT